MELQLPPSARREEGRGGLMCTRIENQFAAVEIYDQGAHITRFHAKNSARPLLWMSRESLFEEEKPLRGGVPICFPWFGPNADLPEAPAHGVARTGAWNLIRVEDESNGTRLVYVPSEELEEEKFWPDDIRVTFQVLVGSSLGMSFAVENIGTRAVSYEIALHSYFAVGDARLIEVRGLEKTPFWDKVRRAQQPGETKVVRVNGEVDRVYNSSSTCTVFDKAWGREIVVEKQHSNSTIVWNPHEKKSRAMPDFGDEEWVEMVCIETGNVGRHRIELSPNLSHTMSATLSTRE